MAEYGINITELPKVKKQEYKIDLRFSDAVPKSLVELGHDEAFFLERKKVFETPEEKGLFYKYKNFINPYNLVNFNFGSIKSIESLTGIRLNSLISAESVVSRAYYKMMEMAVELSLIPNNKKSIISANIAEAPGGFIQALIDLRKGNESNHYYTISLKENEESSRSYESKQKRIVDFMKKYRDDNKIITIDYGKNGTGDLNKIENIIAFAGLFAEKKADIATADGGFESDESVYENPEVRSETRTLQLVYNEIITILSVLAEGGSSILKVFGTTTSIMLEYLYLHSLYFDEVYIVKPITSKIVSNERYIVGKGFRGIAAEELKQLYGVAMEWYKVDPTGGVKMPAKFIDKIFDFDIPKTYIKVVKDHNEWWFEMNRKINKEIRKMMDANKAGKVDTKVLRKILEKQQEIALKWFKKYGIPIVKESVIDFSKVSKIEVKPIVKTAKEEPKAEPKVKEEKKEVKKEVKKEAKAVKKTVKKAVKKVVKKEKKTVKKPVAKVVKKTKTKKNAEKTA